MQDRRQHVLHSKVRCRSCLVPNTDSSLPGETGLHLRLGPTSSWFIVAVGRLQTPFCRAHHDWFSYKGHASVSTAAGGGGKPCKVDKQCYLLLDPCASRSTPWDCLANTTCQFVPSQDSMMGGTCRTVQQYDPCVGLTATTCSSNPACTMADR